MDNAIPTPGQPGAAAAPTMPISAEDADWTGQVLGEFRILHRLGRGGMGQVYLAEQTSLKRKVALKLLHPELASNQQSLLRFKAEAENVARATHANIVQIYTINQDKGIHFLALEYVEGKNLREFIEKKGTPELSLGLHVMMQVAAALQRASELGIIHRDIKPENILLTKKGEVKVADFGLSRCFADEGQQTITQSQVAMGTPLYMSPEQVERKTVDTRTDIYSFGVTCYHMFAGTPPFRGASPIEVAYQHVHTEAPSLATIRPDLPAALCAIIQKMMAKKPDDRYQSAREIVRDINQLRESLNLGAVAAISMSSSFIGAGSDGLRTSAIQPPPEPAPKPWLWQLAIAGSVFLALTGGLLIGWVQHLGKPVVVPPPQTDGKEVKPTVAREDEKAMLQQVQKSVNPGDDDEMIAGLRDRIQLGFYYLRAKRLDDADRFFLELSKPDNKIATYRLLGRLGHAMTLAFKDDPKASNDEFLVIIAEMEAIEAKGFFKKKDPPPLDDTREACRRVWKLNTQVREMVAKALDYNYVNDAKGFPADKLDPYRLPPRPTLKAAPGS
jgi:serine/threonine-protein kinase